jgi:hypothetical protein
MSHQLDRLLLFASMLVPIGFALMVWLNSRRPYPSWAKAASVIACAAGVAWDVITLFQKPLSVTRYPFLLTVSIKQSLAGVFVGIALAIVIARHTKAG